MPTTNITFIVYVHCDVVFVGESNFLTAELLSRCVSIFLCVTRPRLYLTLDLSDDADTTGKWQRLGWRARRERFGPKTKRFPWTQRQDLRQNFAFSFFHYFWAIGNLKCPEFGGKIRFLDQVVACLFLGAQPSCVFHNQKLCIPGSKARNKPISQPVQVDRFDCALLLLKFSRRNVLVREFHWISFATP